jgi:hypothetical protein
MSKKKSTSPTPKDAKRNEHKNDTEYTPMSFGDALRVLTTGDYRARRIGWDNEDAYITIRALGAVDALHYFDGKEMHTLIATTGDIVNEDWIIL